MSDTSHGWSGLKGHEEQRLLLQRSMARNRLSHACVFAGPDGIGKKKFARLFAQSLFCRLQSDNLEICGDCRACRGFSAGTWPDYLEIGLPAGKSEIPISAVAGEDEKRGREGLCYELSMAPQASMRRIAVINDAHRLTTEAANALLKTLEEPPANALILLICDDPDSLLPTIRSRCQVIRFFPLNDAEVEQILLHEQIVDSAEEARAIAQLAEGSMTIAVQLHNPELRRLRDLVEQQFNLLDQMKPLETAREIGDELEKISSGADELRRNGQWLLRFVAQAANRRMRRLVSGDFSDPLLQKTGIRGGLDLLLPVTERLIQASSHIQANTGVRLVLDSLFDDLARQFRLGPPAARG